MRIELEDAATAGYSLTGGVADLDAAFSHLEGASGIMHVGARAPGEWTDNSTDDYRGDYNKLYSRRVTNAPAAAKNFLDAMDAKMRRVASYAQDYADQMQRLREAQDASAWGQINTIISNIAQHGGHATRLLFFSEGVQTRAEGIVSAAEVISNIQSGLNTYASMRGAGDSNNAAASMALLRAVVPYLPVLGEVYGQAIDMIPTLRTWWQGVINNRILVLEGINRGVDIRENPTGGGGGLPGGNVRGVQVPR